MKKLLFLAVWIAAIWSAEAQTMEVKHTLDADSTTVGVEIQGSYTFGAGGDDGGGSLEAQLSGDNVNWTTYATFTTDSLSNVECNCWFRWKLSDATDPDLDTYLKRYK